MVVSYIIISGILNIPPFPIIYKVIKCLLFYAIFSNLLFFSSRGFPPFVLMAAQSGSTPFEVEFKLLGDAYGLSPADGVEFPSPKLMILSPPPGKVGIYLKTLDAGLRLPLSDFLGGGSIEKWGSIQMLTPNVVNKVVAFKMICRANDLLPYYFVLKYFFRFCATGDKYTFSVRCGGIPWFSMGKPLTTSRINRCGLTVV